MLMGTNSIVVVINYKRLHCDDLHIILSLSAVQIYEFHILIFIHSQSTG